MNDPTPKGHLSSAGEAPDMTSPGDRAGKGPVKALAHAIDVLEAIAARREQGVSEIARETGLSKSAVFNILATFEAHRLVTRDAHTARYRLGWRLYELGAELLQSHDLAPRARPFVQRLSVETHETVLLGILDRDGVTYVDRYEADRAIRMVARPGRQAPLHATASGKVLLAHLDDVELEHRLADDLRAYTPKTITDPSRLHAELEKVRRTGYALCDREHEPELISVSVPVRDYTGDVVAALTLAAPVTRFGRAERQRALRAVRAAAAGLSAELGARAGDAA
jgi:DNA-binding IclR family transcriptional regulator